MQRCMAHCHSAIQRCAFLGSQIHHEETFHLLDEVGDEMGGLSWVASLGEQHREVAGHLGEGARISIAYSGP